MIRFTLAIIFVTLAAAYLLALYILVFAWRHTIRPLRFWLFPSIKVLVRSVIR